MAEAIGQLAAWAAMDQLDYRLRPVAGIATEAEFLGRVAPGQSLELEVELEACSEDDVVYSGRAQVEDIPVLTLRHCLGPMLPMATFDDPELVRERFHLLRHDGAAPDCFQGVPAPALDITDLQDGASLNGQLRIPEEAPFFADHFPRRPVFPATLLLDAMTGVARQLLMERADRQGTAPVELLRVLNMKMRSFLPPGEVLDIRVDLSPPEPGPAKSKLVARLDGRSVATARAEFGHRENHHEH
jgi:3-hydroxymyristoyl/3-hydroxydecanoyl-(acyl carrier protein) dehydratase